VIALPLIEWILWGILAGGTAYSGGKIIEGVLDHAGTSTHRSSANEYPVPRPSPAPTAHAVKSTTSYTGGYALPLPAPAPVAVPKATPKAIPITEAKVADADKTDGQGARGEGETSVNVKDLKRLPNDKVKELGGEEYTQPAKANTGKSKADLYWNPKTGDVYSIPKGGGPPEHVDTIPTGR